MEVVKIVLVWSNLLDCIQAPLGYPKNSSAAEFPEVSYLS